MVSEIRPVHFELAMVVHMEQLVHDGVFEVFAGGETAGADGDTA